MSWPWQVTDGREQAGFHPSLGVGHAPDLLEKGPAKGPTAHITRLAAGYPTGHTSCSVSNHKGNNCLGFSRVLRSGQCCTCWTVSPAWG